MTKRAVLLAGIVVLWLASPVQAVWMRSASLEWWTNVSDSVLVARVAQTSEGNVICTAVKTLRGREFREITFHQDGVHTHIEPDREIYDTKALVPGDDVLLFHCDVTRTEKNEVIFWVNLSRPDGKCAAHGAHNNDCTWLANKEPILQLVKARIVLEKPGRRKARGLMVEFTAYEPRDVLWDFVRTADPDYKPKVVKLLQEDHWGAIYNIISYPGQETVDLIKPFLKHAYFTEKVRRDGKNASDEPVNEKFRVYPARELAYQALLLLGDRPEKPDGYVENSSSFFYGMGFEGMNVLGDWKRVKKQAQFEIEDDRR